VVKITVHFSNGKMRTYQVADRVNASIIEGMLTMGLSNARTINVPMSSVDVVDTTVLTDEEATKLAANQNQKASKPSFRGGTRRS